jgi:phenylpropionate dioxygenase-like ring-hydroxylating dioxygenase large terminal subunit
MEFPDRARKERYFDPDFYQMEVDLLWPRVWQMACRLEEIPQPNDFVEYEIFDQSVIVVRTADLGVRAFQNTCRHRGVRIVEGSGTCESGFICPFHGWCYGADGKNTFVTQKKSFAEHNLAPGRTSIWCRCAATSGAAAPGSTFDADAPPLRSASSRSPPAMDAWKVESMRAEWWYACRLPVNWKLAEEAFMEQYHVIETHPQLVIPKRYPPRNGGEIDPGTFIEAELHYLRRMSEGMGGMVHANDVAVASASGTSPHRPRSWPDPPGSTALNECRRAPGTGPRLRTSPTSTTSSPGHQRDRWATASRTTSCCPCTAAPPPTASGRSDPRRP